MNAHPAHQRLGMVLFSTFPASKTNGSGGRRVVSSTDSLTGMVSVNELPNRNHCSEKELDDFEECIHCENTTYQYYYDSNTKEEDEQEMEKANNIWLSFNSPLCSHSPFESHNSLEWRLNRTKRSPHP